LKVALDATYSTGRNLSGVGVYSREILHGLAAAHPETSYLWCYRPHRLTRCWREPRPPGVSVRPLFEHFQLFRPELFHGLNQRLPAARFRRAVCTFHDLFVFTSDYSSADFRERFIGQARQAAERANLIICVSTFTANQVHELLGVERMRLRVIPHGTAIAQALDEAARQPVVLHVGALQRRKNLGRLIAAFERAAAPPWRLVLAGADGYDAAAIHARIAASPARDRIETPGWVSSAELDALYRRATLFVFPSLDEGFGIPVLEAMAYGLPVISSDRAALPEACGGAAWLVDPLEEQEIEEALKRLIGQEALRKQLRAAGFKHAASWSWSRAVESTWRVYQELGV
jgi:glycosyltransferase involved in cell wall biosynthesis